MSRVVSSKAEQRTLNPQGSVRFRDDPLIDTLQKGVRSLTIRQDLGPRSTLPSTGREKRTVRTRRLYCPVMRAVARGKPRPSTGSGPSRRAVPSVRKVLASSPDLFVMAAEKYPSGRFSVACSCPHRLAGSGHQILNLKIEGSTPSGDADDDPTETSLHAIYGFESHLLH